MKLAPIHSVLPLEEKLLTCPGNLKAAITADVIQGITMIIISFGVIAQGIYESGGVEKVYAINKEHNRLNFFNFTGDITTRVDTLSAWLGQLFISLSVLGCQQNNVQRYMSMKSQKDVTNTLMANVPFVSLLFSLSWLVGMGIYATYYNCDPYRAGYIEKTDEILPYFIIHKLAYLPGFMGLFMATLFNGSLCIFVSTLNSIATVTWEDFLSPLSCFKKYSDFNQLVLIKSLGVTYAFICMAIAYLVSLFSGVIEISMFVNAATSGTLVGVFILAMVVPFANSKGASIGIIVSHSAIIALTITAHLTNNLMKAEYLPTSIEGCNATGTKESFLMRGNEAMHYERYTQVNVTTANTELPIADSLSVMWSILESFVNMSYMYYSVFGSIVTVGVGIIVSLCTTGDDYDPKLIHPMISRRTHNAESNGEKPIRKEKCVSHPTSVTTSTSVAIPEKY